MELDVKTALTALLFDWLLPVAVVFGLEVLGYLLYCHYRQRRPFQRSNFQKVQVAQKKTYTDVSSSSARYRSDCSTDLSSDVEFIASRQESGEQCASKNGVLSEQSCEFPSRVTSLALDAVIMKHNVAPPKTNGQSHMLGPSTKSLVCDEESSGGEGMATYTRNDLLQVLCQMRQSGQLDKEHILRQAEQYRGREGASLFLVSEFRVETIATAPEHNSQSTISLQCVRPASMRGSMVKEQHLRRQQHFSAKNHTAPPTLVRMSGNTPDTQTINSMGNECASSCSHEAQTSQALANLERREQSANSDARPLLHKALKFRQFDIASTIYLGFKHERISIRPETFILLVQVALSSKMFPTCVEWLVELLEQHDVNPEWLDRVIAAVAVGAPPILSSLLQQLERLKESGRLSTACSAVVAEGFSYLAIANARNRILNPTEDKQIPTKQTGVSSPLQSRVNSFVPPSTAGTQSASNLPRKPRMHCQENDRTGADTNEPAKGLNPNAPEFVPVSPIVTSRGDLQEKIAAHQQLRENILSILAQQKAQASSSQAPSEASPEVQEENLQRQESAASETPAEDQRESTDSSQQDEPSNQNETKSTSEEASEPETGENKAPQPQQESTQQFEKEKQPEAKKHKKKQDQECTQEQGHEPKNSLAEHLKQHLERALLQQGPPPGLSAPRRNGRIAKQNEGCGGLPSKSCSKSPSAWERRGNDVLRRQRVADAILSSIANRKSGS